MPAKQTSISRYFMMVLILLTAVMMTACGVEEFTQQMMADDDFISEVSDPAGDADAMGELSREADVYQVYYDEKTGMAVSKVKYYSNNIADGVKYYGIFIALPSCVIGFLIRRLVKGSAGVRKFGFVLEIWIPIAWVVLAYVISFLADKVK